MERAIILAAMGGWAFAAWATEPCSRKRVDACGCHHVYGLRHCHPNRKSTHCELPAKGTQTYHRFTLRSVAPGKRLNIRTNRRPSCRMTTFELDPGLACRHH